MEFNSRFFQRFCLAQASLGVLDIAPVEPHAQHLAGLNRALTDAVGDADLRFRLGDATKKRSHVVYKTEYLKPAGFEGAHLQVRHGDAFVALTRRPSG